ncbi:MAG: transposase family protein [Chloroflexi bacterium]|nr:transposase family protein [Chloroflexota bacterium]
MPSDDKMNVDERRKYLKLVLPRYAKAALAERSSLLTEMEAITGLHRKSLLRRLHGPTLERAPRRPRLRRRRYEAAVGVVRVVWESLDYVCAERLTPVLLSTAQQLAQWGELALTPEIEAALGAVSRPTVQRLLQRFQQDSPKLPRRKPQPPNHLLRDVPMERLAWATASPGSFEADLVHHCGLVATGEYIHTLQLVDIATGWSERVAVLGRSQAAMVKGFRRVQSRLPFPITHLHPDNGSEFFNDHLIRYFGEEVTGLRLSRSRPYRKNDNRFVEQKNSTLVRAYVGYERLDTGGQCAALNALYDQLWVYYNLFQPVLHMVEKEVVDGKLRRKWDKAQTPYQRLLACRTLSLEQEVRLAALYAGTNPRQLRREIYQALERLRQRPGFSDTTNRKEAALLR